MAFLAAQAIIPAVLSLGQHAVSESHETTRHYQENRPTTHNQTSSNVYAVVNVNRSTPHYTILHKKETSLGTHFTNGIVIGAGIVAGTALVAGAIAGAKMLFGGEKEKEKEVPVLGSLTTHENKYSGEDVLFTVEVEEVY